jgi:hypothetical protein
MVAVGDTAIVVRFARTVPTMPANVGTIFIHISNRLRLRTLVKKNLMASM